MTEYNAGDSISIKGNEYQILYFHKGTGSSPLTARLRGKNGFEMDILKSELKADEPVKDTVKSVKQEVVTTVAVPLEKIVEEQTEKIAVEKKAYKKKYKKNK